MAYIHCRINFSRLLKTSAKGKESHLCIRRVNTSPILHCPFLTLPSLPCLPSYPQAPDIHLPNSPQHANTQQRGFYNERLDAFDTVLGAKKGSEGEKKKCCMAGVHKERGGALADTLRGRLAPHQCPPQASQPPVSRGASPLLPLLPLPPRTS